MKYTVLRLILGSPGEVIPYSESGEYFEFTVFSNVECNKGLMAFSIKPCAMSCYAGAEKQLGGKRLILLPSQCFSFLKKKKTAYVNDCGIHLYATGCLAFRGFIEWRQWAREQAGLQGQYKVMDFCQHSSHIPTSIATLSEDGTYRRVMSEDGPSHRGRGGPSADLLLSHESL